VSPVADMLVSTVILSGLDDRKASAAEDDVAPSSTRTERLADSRVSLTRDHVITSIPAIE